MKRFQVLLLVCAFVFGMACMHATPAESATIIKIAGMKPEGEPETIAMHSFGKHLERLSNGKYKVQVFPNSMLGKEDAYIANTRKGIIQMCATGTQTSSLQPSMGMLETPMLFDSYEHAHRAMTGKTFELINEGFPEKSGLRMLNAFPLGFRNFYTKHEVKSINDIKGLRMRVPCACPTSPSTPTLPRNAASAASPCPSQKCPLLLTRASSTVATAPCPTSLPTRCTRSATSSPRQGTSS